MSRTDATAHTGRFTLGTFRSLEAQEAPVYLEQQIASLRRVCVIRCVYRQGTDYPEHFHPQEQVTVVVEGGLAFTIAGETIQVRQGQAISIEPEIRHATCVASGFTRAIAYNLFVPKGEKGGSATDGSGVRTFRGPIRQPAPPTPPA